MLYICGPLILFYILFLPVVSYGQLKIKERNPGSMTGSEFAESISDSSLTLINREKKIYHEVRSGNIPAFYRNLLPVKDSTFIKGKEYIITFYSLPDYLAIGSDDDYFYCPMTPVLAQRIARSLNCSLPTRKMSDMIYQAASVKMEPQPIPPSVRMTTIPVFIEHNKMIQARRQKTLMNFPEGKLVAGNKKDIVISNKIYNKDGRLRVVIYGWHQSGGQAIQPLYGGHTADWVDYSHGVRLVQNKVEINGKAYKIKKVLRSPELYVLLSDEGTITRPFYPKKYRD